MIKIDKLGYLCSFSEKAIVSLLAISLISLCFSKNISAAQIEPNHLISSDHTHHDSQWSGPVKNGRINFACLPGYQAEAVFTGSFTPDPCDTSLTGMYWHNANRTWDSIVPFPNSYDEDIVGGTILTNYFEDWWKERFLKALNAMTKQLHSGRIEQSRQIGNMFDAHVVKKSTKEQQQDQLKEKKANAPSEHVCTVGSNADSLSKTSSTANALTKGLKADMAKRAVNAEGSASSTGLSADQKIRWDHYCDIFHDPDNNNGVSSCPQPDTAGAVMNGDIDIEGLLLSDTIDITNPDVVVASVALLENLVQPTVKEKIPKKTVNTLTGREWLLKQQHIESVRNIATDVVASIMSRRAAVTGTFSGLIIKPIRENAGVKAEKISGNPSYNEIMQALTKERFFDPNYFIRAQSGIAALKQEQTSIAALTNMQLRDIYRLQEQINLLLAARAAMKFNSDPKGQELQNMPMQ